MSVADVREFLLWCAVLNFGVLLMWSAVYVIGHEWLKELHMRWFHLSEEGFVSMHFLGLMIYKIGIILFNLVPLLVLSQMQ